MKLTASILIIALLHILSVCGQSSYSVSNPIQEAIRKLSLKKDDVVVIAFVIPGECVKCNLALSSALTWVNEKISKRKIKSIGFVACQREIELKQHAPHFPMFDLLLMDDGGIKEQMKIPLATRVVICDHNGNILGIIGYEEYFGDIQSAFKRILKIK
ncbi:MAG: hypothetical protein JNJ94_08270 [Chlorobi bacterium]|jgi:hypothetical protein|nr:hypothetical protein [Chlorobiota bacterium]